MPRMIYPAPDWEFLAAEIFSISFSTRMNQYDYKFELYRPPGIAVVILKSVLKSAFPRSGVAEWERERPVRGKEGNDDSALTTRL